MSVDVRAATAFPNCGDSFLRPLTPPHFLDLRRIAGSEPTDTAEAHPDIVVNGRKLTEWLMVPDSAPERIGKLIRLVHTLGEGKPHLPQDKKCRP